MYNHYTHLKTEREIALLLQPNCQMLSAADVSKFICNWERAKKAPPGQILRTTLRFKVLKKQH